MNGFFSTHSYQILINILAAKAGENRIMKNDVYEDSEAILHNYQEAEHCTEEILQQVVNHHYLTKREASEVFDEVFLHDRCIFEKPLDDKTIRDIMWNNLFSVLFHEHLGQMLYNMRLVK